MVARFEKAQKLVIVVAPGGTRRYSDHWKSGFYWIAFHAKVPLLCAYVSYARKQVHLGLSFIPTGIVTEDMDRIRVFYEPGEGRYPHQAAAIRLRDEPDA
jgi:1-acyl-sn-glycerol-3-phosphate acyltransferase